MKTIELNISDFMIAAHQDCPSVPTIPPLGIRLLRANLIMEEAFEQVEALGFVRGMKVIRWIVRSAIWLIAKLCPGPVCLVEVADSTADQVYVSVGTAVACGIRMTAIWQIVHDSNMAKFGPGSYRRADGKQMKPPGWVPPTKEIESELRSQELKETA